MRSSLFQRGLAPRLLASVFYGAVAFGTVALLAPAPAGRGTRPAGDIAEPSTPASPVAGKSILCLESLRPVAVWEVRIDGAAVRPRRSDETTWIAEAALGPETSLVVDATPAGDAGAAGRNALRIRIAGTPASRDQTFWCERGWSITAQAGRLTGAPQPIDPEDLP